MVFWPPVELPGPAAARKRLRGAEVNEEPAAKAARGVDRLRSSHVAAAYGRFSCSAAPSPDEEMPLAPQSAALLYTLADRWQQGCDFNYAI